MRASKHAPDSEPGKRVTGAGAHTANRNEKRRRASIKMLGFVSGMLPKRPQTNFDGYGTATLSLGLNGS
jgi:hypothetical protein